MALYIDENRVRQLLNLQDLLAAVREALQDLSAGRVCQPLRLTMGFDAAGPVQPGGKEGGGLLFVKPSQVGDALATKLITLVPDNPSRGLPSMMATIVLTSPLTGQTLAILEANWITAMRTAAASAVAADVFTPNRSLSVAMLGSGVLARSHARFMRAIRPVHDVRVWSRDPQNAQACAKDVDGRACASAEEAVRDADVVCTVSNASEPILQGAWLKPGAFVAAVGAPRPTWRELDDAAMQHWIVADQREAAEKESGDVIHARAKVSAELGDILLGRQAAPAPGTTVIFKSLGQAVEDAVAARLVYQAALSAPDR